MFCYLLLTFPANAFLSRCTGTCQNTPKTLTLGLLNAAEKPTLSTTTLRHALTYVSGGSTTLAAVASTTSQYLVRIVFLRALAFVYGVAFLVAYRQNKALIGDRGITPARSVLQEAQKRGQITRKQRRDWLDAAYNKRLPINENPNSIWDILSNTKLIRRAGLALNRNDLVDRFREVILDRTDRMDRPVTSILWLAKDRSNLNRWLDGIALTGMATATLVFLLGAANFPLLLILWICQRSLMAVGGPWYGYGWEPQLAELGFHALFMVPLLSLNPLSEFEVPRIVAWMLRWFLFRIMMGAGLIKLKSGDKKWKDFTAMNYFYETQPIPNPLTRYFHFMPTLWHKWEVLTNHFVELIAPWLLILPMSSLYWRRAAGLIQIAFQSILILSGNLSFLNWLTAVPAIICLDDAFVGPLFFSASRREAALAIARKAAGSVNPVRRVVNIAFGALIMNLSIPVVRNLLAKRQLMNSSFDRFRLVNTYGAFGVVNEERNELIVQAATDVDGPWKEYEFKAKPGDIYRQPPWISPYHYRLDWQLWIASCGRSIERSPWMYKFLLELLRQNSEVLDLLDSDPWRGGEPKYIRVDVYQYKFHRKEKTDSGKSESRAPYWDRKFVRRFYPLQGVATIETLKDAIKRRHPGRPPL